MKKINCPAQWIALCFAAVFSLGYVYVVYAGYTAAPQFDSWRLFVEDRDFLTRGLAHNEHLINFIAVVFLIDNTAFAGRGFVQLVMIAGMLMGLATLFAGQIRQSQPDAGGASVLAVAIFLSATQYTNIVWPFQVGFLGCFVFGSFAAWTLFQAVERSSAFKWMAASILLAFLSALGLAAGVLLFGILAGSVFVLPVPRRAKFLYAAVALACLGFLLFLNPPGQGDHGSKSIIGAVLFALAVLGSVVGAGTEWKWLGINTPPEMHIALAVISGAVLCVVALALLFQVVRRAYSQGRPLTKNWTFPVGVWIVLSAAAIGFGRSHMPIAEALSARYVSLSVLFLGAILVAIAQVWPALARHLVFNTGCLTLVGLLVIAQIDRMAQSEVAGRRFENAEAALLNSAFDAPDIGALYPSSMDASARYVTEIMKIRGISVFGERRYRLIGMNLFAGA